MGFPLKLSSQQQIRDFINLRNNFDKLSFLKTESDKILMQKLPSNIQTKIYTDFLFKDFLWQFRRLFRFTSNDSLNFAMLTKHKGCQKSLKLSSNMKLRKKKTLLEQYIIQKLKAKKDDSDNGDSDESEEISTMKIRFPYYEYKDSVYCEFMLKLMNVLEIRSYKKNEVIAAEMDECMELLFV